MIRFVLWVFLVLSKAVFAFGGGVKVPSFVGFENMKVESITLSNVTIKAEMVINNPNNFKVYLKNMDIKVFSVNNVKLTELVQSMRVEMTPNQNFAMPVELNISPKQLVENGGEVFDIMISALRGKDIILQYNGSCKVEMKLVTLKIPIRYKEKLTF